MYVLVVYVPEGHLQRVKQALFKAGAGALGSYSECSWEVKGWGQFRPLGGSDPHLGEQGMLNRVSEYRVEITLPESSLKEVIQALLHVHPYETPAYHVYRGLVLQDILTAED